MSLKVLLNAMNSVFGESYVDVLERHTRAVTVTSAFGRFPVDAECTVTPGPVAGSLQVQHQEVILILSSLKRFNTVRDCYLEHIIHSYTNSCYKKRTYSREIYYNKTITILQQYYYSNLTVG